MKYFRCKHGDWFCFYCGSQILQGEDCCGLLTKQRRMLLFHIDCYLPWHNENFNSGYMRWKMKQSEDNVKHRIRKRRGRPRKFRSNYKANKIRSLLYYYRKTGNQDKVQELEQMLRDLEIRRK